MERAFELGRETAALTHGHPSGYLSTGFLAFVAAFRTQLDGLFYPLSADPFAVNHSLRQPERTPSNGSQIGDVEKPTR
jgi:hypothetical protein